MKKILFSALALVIATEVFAQVFIKKTEAEAKQAWPLQSECQTCRQVLIDLEPIYKRLCGRNISDAETPFLLGQMPIKRMVSIREKEQHIKLKDAEFNLQEADLVTYRINSKRMMCVSQEEVAGITSDRPQAPTE